MSGMRMTMVLITVVHGVWASLFAFVTPIFESPDENAHVENVCHVLQAGGMPDSAPVVYAADGHGVFEGHQPPLYYLVCAGVAAVLRLNPCERLPRANSDPDSPSDALMFFRHDRPGPWIFGDAFGNPVVLPRIISVVFGMMTVMAAFCCGALVAPGSRSAPILAATWVGLNPQFLFISGSASNDSMAAAVGSLMLVWLLRTWRARELTPRSSVLGGALLGVGILTKASTLFLALPIGLALYVLCSRWRERIRYGCVFGFSTLVVCGWFFARNWLLRGDPTLWQLQLDKLPHLVAGTTPSLEYVIHVLPEVTFRSYWGVFGWMNLPLPEWLHRVTLMVSGIAGAGCLTALLQEDRDRRILGLLLLSGIVSLGAALLMYNLTFRQPQGRLLFPGISWLAVLVALGLGVKSSPKVDFLRNTATLVLIAGMSVIAIGAFDYYVPEILTAHWTTSARGAM